MAMSALRISFLLLFAIFFPFTSAQPYPVPFTSCLTSNPSFPPSYLLNITEAWLQIVPASEATALSLPANGKRVLRIDIFGETGEQFVGFNNDTGKLATLFSTTSDMTYDLWTTTTYVCNSLFPPSPLPYPYIPNNTTYCPLNAGPFALNLSIPLAHGYPLSTLSTTIRIVDTSVPSNELACVTLNMTTYYPDGWYYSLFFWLPVAMAIGYWVSSWAGRFAAGWVVGRMADGAADGEVQGWGRQGGKSRKWGTMFVSGLSGERLGVSGGLLRFVTPSLRDIFFHLQFCAVLAMVAVNWPGFAYPIFARIAWASLAWNVTLVQGDLGGNKRYDPATPLPLTGNGSSAFADQINSTRSPLYLDRSVPNVFFSIPANASNGMESFAFAVGLRPQDLYGTCIVLFLCLAAGIIAVSLFIWTTHGMLTYVLSPSALGIDPNTTTGKSKCSSWQKARSASSNALATIDGHEEQSKYGEMFASGPSTPGADVPMIGQGGPSTNPVSSRSLPASAMAPSGHPSAWKRLWWRFKIKGPIGAFHYSALCGNLVRIIIMFHLPITAFSIYQCTIRHQSSQAVVVLAALSFAAFSVILPAILLTRVALTPTAKLYDATRTLLSLGPLYNVYRPGSQLYPALTLAASLATGIVVGAGQKSGTAQAIVLLIVEITLGLATTIWQPWGEGSGMGIPGFLFSVVRIISTVLLLILSPAIDIGYPASGWVAYVILLLQAITIVFFLIMLFCKILEGLIRLFGNVRFDESKHQLDGGLFAAFGGLRARKHRRGGKPSTTRKSSGHGSVNTQMMLDRYSDPRASGLYENGNPFGEGMTYSNDYFPPQRPTSNGMDFAGRAGMSTNVPTFEERLATAQPQRGFSVVGGGRSNYEDPYSSVPLTVSPGQPVPLIRASYAGTSGPSSASGSNKPVPPRHVRTKSQTAIIETLPASGNPSPTSGTSPYLTPMGTPGEWPQQALTPMSASPHRMPVSLSGIDVVTAARLGGGQAEARSESPTSAYSIEAPAARNSKRANKPSTWFGRSGKQADSDASDSDNGFDNTDFGPAGNGRAGTEPSRPGYGAVGVSGSGWRSRLGIGGSKTSVLPDEKKLDENALRKAQIADYEAAVAKANPDHETVQPPSSNGHRSFKVMRTPRSDNVPLPSGGPSPQLSRPSTPGEGMSAPAPSDIPSSQSSHNSRSFVVRRPTRPPQQERQGMVSEEPKGSFVINRPNRPS